MEWWNALLPVVTLVLGVLLAEVTTSRRETRQWERTQAAVTQERRQRFSEERASFELEVLSRCHAALGDLARACGRVHFLDSQVAKASGRYASHQLPEDASDALFRATRTLYDVSGLILDDRLRSLVSAAHAAAMLPSQQFNSTPDHAEALFSEAVLQVHVAQEAVSERIRMLRSSTD